MSVSRRAVYVGVLCGSAVLIPHQLGGQDGAASVDAALPRSVELASGGAIQLGAPLPPGLSFERSSHSGPVTLNAQAAGRFAGANAILALVTADGLVARIELHYAAGVGVDDLVRRVESDFGPAESRGSFGASWGNQATAVRIFPSESPGSPVRLVLIDPRY